MPYLMNKSYNDNVDDYCNFLERILSNNVENVYLRMCRNSKKGGMNNGCS